MRATKIRRWGIGMLLLCSMLVILLAASLASAEDFCYGPPRKGLMHMVNDGKPACIHPPKP